MKRFSGSAVSRYQIFILADGTFVVQWDEHRVQELLTGQYREFDYKKDFGHAITNYELAQLRTSGRVEHFNRHYVWLYPLPEAGRFGQRRVLGRGDKVRAYYLTTPYTKSQLDEVRATLTTLDLNGMFSVRLREENIVILGSSGMPFRTLEDAEKALSLVQNRAPELFKAVAIAFVETDAKQMPTHHTASENDNLNLEDIIASQTDISLTQGKLVVLALNQDDEREAFRTLLEEMKLEVKNAASASEALPLLEDNEAKLFIMDMELPDLHGWKFISKIREIDKLRNLPILIITDHANIGVTTIAKVEYLVRPVSIARLRQNVWLTLKQKNGTKDS